MRAFDGPEEFLLSLRIGRDPAPAEVARLPPVAQVGGAGQGKGSLEGEGSGRPVRAAVPTDEIYERYLQEGDLRDQRPRDEIARAGDELRVPVVGSGHPLADIILLKYGRSRRRSRRASPSTAARARRVLKSLQRLHVDPMAVYGTNCLKFGTRTTTTRRVADARAAHRPAEAVVAMGERRARVPRRARFPLSDRSTHPLGELQRFTPTIQALVTPDIDASLDEAACEDGVLERVQGARPLVGGAASVLSRRRAAALGVVLVALVGYAP